MLWVRDWVALANPSTVCCLQVVENIFCRRTGEDLLEDTTFNALGKALMVADIP